MRIEHRGEAAAVWHLRNSINNRPGVKNGDRTGTSLRRGRAANRHLMQAHLGRMRSGRGISSTHPENNVIAPMMRHQCRSILISQYHIIALALRQCRIKKPQ